jgi:riboflavin synthase
VFTGIIEEVGKVLDLTPSGSGVRLTIAATKMLDDIEIGASIAVNGCCLTVTDYGDNWWSADAVPETMDRTSLGSLTQQSLVNLERPVQPSGRLGGHIVQGHVDSTTQIMNIESEDDGSYKYTFNLNDSWSRYICEKGSIAIDGISLTVANVDDTSFSIAIIPHTWEVTNLSNKTSGDSVNIEVDVLAKYVERQLIHKTKKEEDHA